MSRSALLALPLALAGCPKDPGSAPEAGSSSTTGGFEATSSTDTVANETTTDETATSSSGDTTEPECTASRGCTDEARPVCDLGTGTCVACDAVEMPDQACASADIEHPFCVEGRCVQCTARDVTVCAAQSLVCDAASLRCVACTEHDQCDVGACMLAEGTCFPSDAVVVHVDGDEEPLPSLMAGALNTAVSEITPGGHAVIVVHERDDGGFYGPVVVDGGKIIALLAATNEAPQIIGFAGNSGVFVGSNGTVIYMDGLQIRGSGGPGLQVTGARVWVDRSRIVQNAGGGIVAQSDTDGNGAVLTLRNSFVGGNVSDVDVITLDASSLEMLYTTVGGGAVAEARTRALFCQGTAMADVRNSILVSFDPMPAVECPGVEVVTSATEAEVGNLTSMWFAGYAAGDFHLSATGDAVFADIAQWQQDDPPTDIDGDARPTTPGAPDHAGADVP